MKKILFMSLLFLTIYSCGDINNSLIGKDDREYTIIEAPADIVSRAFSFAELYKESDTVYEYGGQDPVRCIKIDCSGLVVMCYKYAMVDTKYELIQSDMTANYIFRNGSIKKELSSMKQGDLIFMGDANSDEITHIAIFDSMSADEIFFIDSTKKDDIDGVTKRSYPLDDKRFKSFGRMAVKY